MVLQFRTELADELVIGAGDGIVDAEMGGGVSRRRGGSGLA